MEGEQQKGRGPGRPFSKGISGNAAGRQRSGEALAEYVRELAGPDGRIYVDRLHRPATGKKQKDLRIVLAAIGLLLERGFGKPAQAIEHNGRIDSEISATSVAALNDEELYVLELLMRKASGREAPELRADRVKNELKQLMALCA